LSSWTVSLRAAPASLSKRAEQDARILGEDPTGKIVATRLQRGLRAKQDIVQKRFNVVAPDHRLAMHFRLCTLLAPQPRKARSAWPMGDVLCLKHLLANERMLYYYYYGSKEGLYVAVLEGMYLEYANREAELDLSGLAPSDAIRLLAQTIWTYVRENPGWLCLINNENLHQGRYVKSSTKFRETISPVVETLRTILARGVATGEFRPDVDALDFYVTLVGMGYYIISSRFTLEEFLGRNYMDERARESISAMHVDMLLTYLRPQAGATVAS
jgi:AcrR family transcriptional regulator